MALKRELVLKDVVAGLLAQGEWATENSSCSYRTFNGLKCGIGMLISDEQYCDEMEDKQAKDEIVYSRLDYKYGGVDRGKDDHIFLMMVQTNLHDNLSSGEFTRWRVEAAASTLAHIYDLDIT